MKLCSIAKALAIGFCAIALSASVNAQLAKQNPMHENLPDQPTMDQCFACHQSYEAVAQRTENMQPNPHNSHRGDVQCTNCHSVRGQPHFECNDCHEIPIQMKGAPE